MRKATLFLSSLTAAALLALVPGCGSGGGGETPPPSTPPPVTPPPATPPPAPGTGGGGNVELAQFARTLIEQDTNDTAKPRELGGTTFVDSEDANAFPEGFFTPQ